MTELLTNPDVWLTLITLSALEIILGVDNLVMIAILVSALPKNRQNLARKMGIGFALLTRIGLLFAISWLARLTNPLFMIMSHPFSLRDLIMLGGGLFLLYKGFKELIELRHPDEVKQMKAAGTSLLMVAIQIGIFDIVFSLDSVITAVGMSNHLPVMVTAVVIAMGVMLFASGPVVKLINAYLSIKILALCFLVLIGIMLIGNGFGYHIPKGYIYTAMGFAAFVQVIWIWVTESRKKYHLDEGPQA